MRSKEASDDYRYFPEPDLRPIAITMKDIQALEQSLPELPQEKRKRFMSEYELPADASSILVADKHAADYFESVVGELKNWLFDIQSEGEGTKEEIWARSRKKLTKLAYSWMTSELFKHLKGDQKRIDEIALTPENFAEFIVLVYEAKVNSSAAQTILEKMYHEGLDPSDIAADNDLFQKNDERELEELVQRVIDENQEQVEDYVGGKHGVLQFLVGKVMKLSKGSANPQIVAKLIKDMTEK
jgi:aspartyl-tRNA(Asn)/glutamyl-tRNA(Gln) amidotransferase subunit B